MTVFEIVLGLLVLGGFGVMINMIRNTKPMTDNAEVATLKKELEDTKEALSTNKGSGKQLFIELEQTKGKLLAVQNERDELQKKVTKYETTEEQRQKEHKEIVQEQANSRQAFKEAKERVIREDEERQKKILEERDRQWKEHENDVIASLTELCKQSQHSFPVFSNENLPISFDGRFKPDFMIEIFSDEYVIFDAKVNKARGRIQSYIDTAVKDTAKKLKGKTNIYPHVFLVVPLDAMSEIKAHVYKYETFTFHIVSKDSLSPILASLKQLSKYKVSEETDPQKRENIVNALSDFIDHIRERNAYDILLTKHGVEKIEHLENIDPNLMEEVDDHSASKKKTSLLSQSELKRLAKNITEQSLDMKKIVTPEPTVSKKMLKDAESVMSEKLL